jgi:hypothetical protein
VNRLLVISLAAALAGCTTADSPLRHDMEQLAELPKKLDAAIKTQIENSKTASAPATAAAPPPPESYSPITKPVVVENPLARPPWEAFAEAGPNANDELDLETLYGPGNVPPEVAARDPDMSGTETASTTPPPAMKAAAKKPEPAKPGQTVIKAVAVPAVSGAKGRGNAELTSAMRKALEKAGWPVITAPRKDALTIRGRVSMSAGQGGTQIVHVDWDVLSPDGHNLGNLKQDNQVPAGSLDKGWGASATDAADAAAEGIFDLVKKYRS